MSELVWIMYFAEVSDSVRETFYLVAIASLWVSGAVALILLLAWVSDRILEPTASAKINLRYFAYPIAAYFLSAGLCSIIPTKTTIYAYAGVKAIESQLEQAAINGTIQNDIYLLIRKKIKDELAEVEGVK